MQIVHFDRTFRFIRLIRRIHQVPPHSVHGS